MNVKLLKKTKKNIRCDSDFDYWMQRINKNFLNHLFTETALFDFIYIDYNHYDSDDSAIGVVIIAVDVASVVT